MSLASQAKAAADAFNAAKLAAEQAEDALDAATKAQKVSDIVDILKAQIDAQASMGALSMRYCLPTHWVDKLVEKFTTKGFSVVADSPMGRMTWVEISWR